MAREAPRGNRAGLRDEGSPRTGTPDGGERRLRGDAPASSSLSRAPASPSRAPGAPCSSDGTGRRRAEVLLCPPRRRLLRTGAASPLGHPQRNGKNILKIKDACRAGGSWVRLYGHSFLRLEIEPRRRPACHRTLQFVWGRVYTPFMKKNLMLQFPTNSRE